MAPTKKTPKKKVEPSKESEPAAVRAVRIKPDDHALIERAERILAKNEGGNA